MGLASAWMSTAGTIAKYAVPFGVIIPALIAIPGMYAFAHPAAGFLSGFSSFYSPLLNLDNYKAGLGMWADGISTGFNSVAGLFNGEPIELGKSFSGAASNIMDGLLSQHPLTATPAL